MSVAGEASSSQGRATSPPPLPQAEDSGVGAQQAPPETLFKQKSSGLGTAFQARVTPSASGLSPGMAMTPPGSRVTTVRRHTPENDRESDARIEQAARATRLKDDLLFLNDVVR